jgi:hypothetical protein
MKTVRQFLVALVVTFALITPAFAGQMDTMIAPPPPASSGCGRADGYYCCRANRDA